MGCGLPRGLHCSGNLGCSYVFWQAVLCLKRHVAVFWQSGARDSLALPCSGDLGCVFPRISQSGYVGCRFPPVAQCLATLASSMHALAVVWQSGVHLNLNFGVIWMSWCRLHMCFAVSWQSGLQFASSVAISSAFC